MSELQGYEYFTNNHNTYTVDIKTGEVFEMKTVTVPIGTKIYTPQQQKIYADKILTEQLKKQALSDLGHFCLYTAAISTKKYRRQVLQGLFTSAHF